MPWATHYLDAIYFLWYFILQQAVWWAREKIISIHQFQLHGSIRGIAFIYVYVITATTTKATIRRILFKLNGSSSPFNSLCVIPNLFEYLRKICFYSADSESTVHFHSFVGYLCIVVIRKRYTRELKS